MSIEKKYERKIVTCQALNVPEGWDMFNLSGLNRSVKIASKEIDGNDVNGYDIKSAMEKYPDHLFVKIFAIEKDVPNDNGDAFSEEELQKAAHTFVGVPLFTNHQNDDIEKARGDCVHAWYDKTAGGIYIIGRVDKVSYPPLARAIEQGYIASTSMGCSVGFSLCSICHKRATTSGDFCTHIKGGKNRKFDGSVECSYHDNPEVSDDEKCPICGSVKGERKKLAHSGSKVYEHNFDLNFIENSFVVNPACHSCGVREVFNVPAIHQKVAEMNNVVSGLFKAAALDENNEYIGKIGGVQELNALKNSMSEMEYVVKSMLDQKENVSISYAKEITEAMQKIQESIDELTEMGYAALPSVPRSASSTIDATESVSPVGIPTSPQPQTLSPTPATPVAQNVSDFGSSKTYDLNGIGEITLPEKKSENKEDFLKSSETIVSNINDNINKLANSVHALFKDMQVKITGENMASQNKEQKTAASADNAEVVTEKQLEKKEESLHPRTDQVYEGVTESASQLGGEGVRKGTYETITEGQLGSDSFMGPSLVRFESVPDVITEKQWTDASRSPASNVSADYTSVITEKQIADLLSKHKFVGSPATITEDQLKNMPISDGISRWANNDYVNTVVKVAQSVLVEMIDDYVKSPSEIKKTIALVNDDSSLKSKVAFLSVINSLPCKSASLNSHYDNINYFSKKASGNITDIDALVLASAHNATLGVKSEDVLEVIAKVLNSKKAMKVVESMIQEKSNKKTAEGVVGMEEALTLAFNSLDKPEDNTYRIKAAMSEIKAPITDCEAFCGEIKKFAQEAIADDSVKASVVRIEIGDKGDITIDVEDGADEEITPEDIFEVVEIGNSNGIGEVEDDETDENINMEDEDVDVEDEEIEDIEDDTMEDEESVDEDSFEIIDDEVDIDDINMAKSRKTSIKTAQMMGGEMGGQGGADIGPGAGADMPAAGMPGAEGVQSFMDDSGAMGESNDGFEEDKKSPLPPGSICPVCGSEDVDIIDGKGKCNNCTSEMIYKVQIEVSKWQGLSDDSAKKEEEGFAGEGLDLSEGVGAGEEELAAAASSKSSMKFLRFASVAKIKPGVAKKIVAENSSIGKISPIDGSTNTLYLGDGEYMSLSDGMKYRVSFKNKGKEIFAQWDWSRDVPVCESCERAKKNLIKSLSMASISEQQFNHMDPIKKMKVLAQLKQDGKIKTIKTAGKEGSIVEDYKLAYGIPSDKFPVESCVEILSRRFGENSVCLSGPDEGKNLPKSVCRRLQASGFYNEKVASIIADRRATIDGDEECVECMVRKQGLNLRQAAEACALFKVAIAGDEDLLLDEIDDMDIEVKEIEGDIVDGVDETDNDVDLSDVDPFDDGDEGTISLELPMSVIEEIDKQLDKALGEDPNEEEHHQDIPEGNADIEIDAEVAEDLDENLGDVLDDAVEEEDLTGEAVEEDMEECGTKPCTIFEEDMISTKDSPCCDDTEKEDEESSTGVTVRVNGDTVLGENQGMNYRESQRMAGAISKVGEVGIDLQDVINVISRQNKAASDSKTVQEKAQDVDDIKPYSDGENGSLMGHEKETIPTAKKPDVPRSNATMGKEPKDSNPQDKPTPEIPSGKAEMGMEAELGFTGGDHNYTGGDKGQGKIETAETDDMNLTMGRQVSSKDSLSRLADAILKSHKKTASDKKLEPKAPVSEDKDVQPIGKGDGSVIGQEDKFEADSPKDTEGNGDESMMGNEKETLKTRPTSPKDHPSIPTGDAQIGQEELDSEKTTKDKGTVIANSEIESEAFRVAARMLAAKRISSDQLQEKVAQLKTYKLPQILDIEKSIFANVKGLETVADGESQVVQIREASTGTGDLKSQIEALFGLEKMNRLADEDEMVQTRKAYGK